MLVETDVDSGTVTTFTVDPVGNGSRVTITTDIECRDGLLGRVERFIVTRLLQPLYVREIEQLGAVASERAKSNG